MAKITKLVGNEYQGKTNYTVTLSDGTVGYLQDKTSDAGLKEGDSVNATIENYTSKAGNQSKLVSLRRALGVQTPTPQSTTSPSNTQPPILSSPDGCYTSRRVMTIDEMKHEARIEVIKVIGALSREGKIEPKEMPEFFNEFYPAVDLSYDVLFK